MVFREISSLASLLLIAVFFQPSACEFTVQLKLVGYLNPLHLKQDGRSCDIFSHCDPVFIGCLSTDNTTQNCDIGTFVTKEYRNKPRIMFGADLGGNLTNPMVFTSKKSLKGMVHVSLRVDDQDDNKQTQPIASYGHTHNVMAQYNEQITTLRSFVTKLKIRVSILNYTLSATCSSDFFGHNCNQFCKPANDASSGHYICDPSTGDKVCLPKYFGEHCKVKCDPQPDDHYACDKDTGDKICEADYYGKDCETKCAPKTNDHYSCDKITGEKVCHENWYGPKCDAYCKTSKYTHYSCNKTSGEKICDKDWYGAECATFCKPSSKDHYNCDKQGNKICHVHWYGRTCATYCKRETGDHFTCNQENGKKICDEHYWGFNCKIHCHAKKNDHYACQKSTGDKVCRTNWYGPQGDTFCRDGNVCRTCDQGSRLVNGTCVRQDTCGGELKGASGEISLSGDKIRNVDGSNCVWTFNIDSLAANTEIKFTKAKFDADRVDCIDSAVSVTLDRKPLFFGCSHFQNIVNRSVRFQKPFKQVQIKIAHSADWMDDEGVSFTWSSKQ